MAAAQLTASIIAVSFIINVSEFISHVCNLTAAMNYGIVRVMQMIFNDASTYYVTSCYSHLPISYTHLPSTAYPLPQPKFWGYLSNLFTNVSEVARTLYMLKCPTCGSLELVGDKGVREECGGTEK